MIDLPFSQLIGTLQMRLLLLALCLTCVLAGDQQIVIEHFDELVECVTDADCPDDLPCVNGACTLFSGTGDCASSCLRQFNTCVQLPRFQYERCTDQCTDSACLINCEDYYRAGLGACGLSALQCSNSCPSSACSTCLDVALAGLTNALPSNSQCVQECTSVDCLAKCHSYLELTIDAVVSAATGCLNNGCVACSTDSDCSSGTCQNNVCISLVLPGNLLSSGALSPDCATECLDSVYPCVARANGTFSRCAVGRCGAPVCYRRCADAYVSNIQQCFDESPAIDCVNNCPRQNAECQVCFENFEECVITTARNWLGCECINQETCAKCVELAAADVNRCFDSAMNDCASVCA